MSRPPTNDCLFSQYYPVEDQVAVCHQWTKLTFLMHLSDVDRYKISLSDGSPKVK